MNGHGFLRNPGKRRGRGSGPSFGRFRFPRFSFPIGRFGNITLRYLWPPALIFRPGGGRPGGRPPPHPLHGLPFVSPGLPPAIAGVVTAAESAGAATVLGPTVPLVLVAAAGVLGLQSLLQEAYLRRLQRELDEQEKELEELRERRRAAQEAPQFEIAPAPDLLPFYDYPILEPLRARPARPQRVETPTLPAVSPVVLPEISPPRPEIFRPPPVEFPSPVVAPPTVRPVPVPFPFEFPQPVTRPLFVPWQIPTLPFAQPVPVPAVPSPPGVGLPGTAFPGLTPFDVTGLPSRFAAPDTSPKGGTKKGSCECPDTRTKKRKKRSDCAKGFYRERAGKITYTPWAKIDCITGEEN
jgi:hypothetical protein